MAYAQLSADETEGYKPKVVFVDNENHIKEITDFEKHGEIK